MVNVSFPDVHMLFYERLKAEVCLVAAKYRIYDQLYNGILSKAVVMKAAPSFFRIYQQQAADDIILSINRITDQPDFRSNSKECLSIIQLQRKLPVDNYPALYPKFETLIKRLVGLSCKLRKWRNRRISHSDVRILLGNESLPPLNVGNIEKCIDTLIMCMRHIDTVFQLGDSSYKDMYLRGDGSTIVKMIIDANEHTRSKKT